MKEEKESLKSDDGISPAKHLNLSPAAKTFTLSSVNSNSDQSFSENSEKNSDSDEDDESEESDS